MHPVVGNRTDPRKITRLRQFLVRGENQLFGFFPVDAFVGDRNAVLELREIFGQALVAGVQIAFEH